MLETLKIHVLRRLIVPVIKLRWLGKSAQNLTTRMTTIPVDGGEIPARIYTPQGQGPFPVILFMHGGGWAGCNIETHDPICRDLCAASAHVIVSIDYRLAPEFPFPIPPKDCIAALSWIRHQGTMLNADMNRLTICGDSAGGNLAAVLAIHARDNFPGLVKGQILIYPATDHAGANQPSYTEFGEGYSLTTKEFRWLWQLYLRNSPLLKPGETKHDLATPLHVKDLSKLPPAFVITAELDLLRDEGLEYANRLKDEGNDAIHKRYSGQQHGYVGGKPSAAHTETIGDITRWLKSKNL